MAVVMVVGRGGGGGSWMRMARMMVVRAAGRMIFQTHAWLGHLIFAGQMGDVMMRKRRIGWTNQQI